MTIDQQPSVRQGQVGGGEVAIVYDDQFPTIKPGECRRLVEVTP